MIIVPIYVAIDTDDETTARAVATGMDGASNIIPDGDSIIAWSMHLVEHRGIKPVLLEVVDLAEADQIRTYLPVPGLIIREGWST